ncbi:large ribosomal subunit protein uL15x-like [Elaeis guineensis]|uniref:large ribosomal subunit protein uL15x-like n=1 Tax=Elaeis guineensis var. tenera TaxID=51953 RepID=UPI003C6D970D
MATAAATMTCIKKNQKYPGGCDDAGGMHHHRVLCDDHHPGYFGKVGKRYFHHLCNKLYCPTVSADRLWFLGPDDVKRPATAYDDSSTPLTDVASFNYEILRWNAPTDRCLSPPTLLDPQHPLEIGLQDRGPDGGTPRRGSEG